MAAICGVVSFLDIHTEKAALAGCLRVLAHNGNESKSSQLGSALFGAALTREESQSPATSSPILGDERHLIVADSRLDNRSYLIDILMLDHLDSAEIADTTLIKLAYQRWGTGCVEHLVGEYSVALWDQHLQSLFLFRDHFGLRPLYFYRCGNRFAFATEIKGLFCYPWVPKNLCKDRLVEFLICQSVDFNHSITFFEGIHRLHAASTLVYSANQFSEDAYWQPDPYRQISLPSDEDYVESFLTLFNQAVERRIPNNSAVGICLSGGFDSSNIALSAASILERRGQTLKAFVSVMPDHYTGSRTEDVRRYCDALGQKISNLELHYVSGENSSLNAGPELFHICEAPTQILQTRLNLLFHKARQEGVNQMLAGYAGDNAVTPRGHGFLAQLVMSGKVSQTIKELRARSALTGRSILGILKNEIIVPLLPSSIWQKLISLRETETPWRVNAICTLSAAQQSSAYSRLSQVSSRGFRSLHSIRANSCRGLAFNMSGRGLEPVYHLASHHQMGFGLPMLDKELVEFALALPADQHVRNGERRYLIRRAFAKKLPTIIYDRKEQNDFIVPDATNRLSEDLEFYCHKLESLAQNESVTSIVDLTKMRTFLNLPGTHKSGRPGLHAQLFFRGYDTANFIEWFEREYQGEAAQKRYTLQQN